MITHDIVSGTPEWHAYRAEHDNASDAPAMMGCSTHETRSELIQRLATGISKPIDSAIQRRFDDGHRFEALARPLAEELMGSTLFPFVVSVGRLSASCDGLTFSRKRAWEHKSLNDVLRAWFDNYDAKDLAEPENFAGNELPMMYQVQMQQQCDVTGCTIVLFTASTWEGDTLVEIRECWYGHNPELSARIAAGWVQLHIDVAAYVPSVIVERPKAAATLALPALFIQAKGEITTSNMQEYGDALAARLKFVRAIALVTDQNFADAKDAAKLLRENIESAKLAKDAMLAQTVTVGEAARMIDAWCEDMRVTALQLEKDVLREDLAKKTAMILATKEACEKHVAALEMETVPHRLVYAAPVFANAIKNKRSFVSMQDGLDTMLAQSKIETNALADKMRANLAILRTLASDYKFLFHDAGQIVSKAPDDLTLLVKARIAEHLAEVAKTEEATRQRIRVEEQIKAEAAARAKVALEVAAALQVEREKAAAALEFERGMADAKRLGDIAAQQNAPQIIQEVIQAAPAVEYIALSAIESVAQLVRVGAVLSDKNVADANANRFLDRLDAKTAANSAGACLTPPSLKLGQIGERLGFQVTSAFLSMLGFEPAAQVKNALLFREADFGLICAALVKHIEAVQLQQAA